MMSISKAAELRGRRGKGGVKLYYHKHSKEKITEGTVIAPSENKGHFPAW